MCQQVVELILVLEQYLTRLASLRCSHDASGFELVHQASSPVVADTEAALYHTRTSLLGEDDGVGCLLEVWVEVTGIYAATASCAVAIIGWLRQLQRFDRTRLTGDVLVDALNLWRVNEGTLYTHRLIAIEVEHITSSDELVGTGAVQDGLGVDG